MSIEVVPGNGEVLFNALRSALQKAVFAASGDTIRHDCAAFQEALELFNHVCVGLDSPPSPKPESTGLTPSQLQARVTELEAVLRLYRAEVPIGHQPPMAAQHVDELLGLSK